MTPSTSVSKTAVLMIAAGCRRNRFQTMAVMLSATGAKLADSASSSVNSGLAGTVLSLGGPSITILS
jgi:hypothetical protein